MIYQLSQELINKIAAGEVVERPNSVIKELVENSIDANSTEIIIEVDTDFIRISDNGSGITKEDLKKLFINHSTSKIKNIEDLSNIHTMGFRGEAIATIASVSKMEIKSRAEEEDHGYSIMVSQKPIPTAMNKGTVIEVKDLFYNVPARKKFLKSESVENKYIIDTITKISIAHPYISFKLTIKGKVIYNLIATDLEKRLKALIPNINLIPLVEDDIISGFISTPKDSFPKGTYQYMFVNSRFINPSPMLSKAVLTGYKNALMRGQYPPYVIFINLRPEEVDVNVHPRKLEVRFENDGYIFQKIYSIIQHTLFREEKEAATPKIFEGNSVSEEVKDAKHDFMTKHEPKEHKTLDIFSNQSIVSKAMQFSSEIIKNQESVFDLVDISTAHQYMNSYIVANTSNSVIIFDQHACAERFTFERLKALYNKKDIKTKRLLIPEEIPEEHIEFLLDQKDLLESFGIKIESKDNKAFINEIPDFASLRLIDQLYSEIKNAFEADLTSVIDLQDKIITSLACHSSIRFGDKLKDQECQKIITDLSTCRNTLTCPHGRPTYYEMSRENLVQIFKR